MNTARLLERIAAALKREIAPAVAEDYPRTQAHMAAVVLERLAAEARLADAHAAAERMDHARLAAGLDAALAASAVPPALAQAHAAFRTAPDATTLAALVTALHAARAELGEARFAPLLARVRGTLRAGLDRRLETCR
jgi:hypothetical protein